MGGAVCYKLHMPERVLLTPEFVNSVEPPEAGERWISDLKVRGFGLRVWRQPHGSFGCAYAVRAKGSDGKYVRKTGPSWRFAYDWREEHQLWRQMYGDLEEPTFGELLPFAREWANEQILALRGLPTLAEQEAEQEEFRAFKRNQMSNLSFEELVELELKRMQYRDIDQNYIDRSAKLFYRYFPDAIRPCKITSIDIEKINLILNDYHLTDSNFNVLRPLIGRSYKLAQFYGPIETIKNWDISKIDRKFNDKVSITQLNDWNNDDTESFINFIYDLDAPWQSRIAICLFLSLKRIPLSQLLSACWDQLEIMVPTDGDQSHASHVNFRWAEGWLGFEQVSKDAGTWLEKALTHKTDKSTYKNYLFPSPREGLKSHLQTIDATWSQALRIKGIPYISVVKFRKSLNDTQTSHLYHHQFWKQAWQPRLTE